MATDLDLLKGTLDVLILRTLAWKPLHGYAAARWIKESSGEVLAVQDRALYLALHRLEARGLLESEWGVSENGRTARYYHLTTSGRRELRKEESRWTRYAEAVFRVLRTVPEN